MLKLSLWMIADALGDSVLAHNLDGAAEVCRFDAVLPYGAELCASTSPVIFAGTGGVSRFFRVRNASMLFDPRKSLPPKKP
jgi:hypothetical protein